MERKNKFGFLCKPLMGLVKKSANTFFQSITENFVNKVKGYFVGTANLILGLFFFFFFWLALNVMIVEVFRQFLHMKIFFSVLIVAILNLIMSVLFLNAGMKKFKEDKNSK